MFLNFFQEAPLHRAIQIGNVEIVKLLLSIKDIDVNITQILSNNFNSVFILFLIYKISNCFFFKSNFKFILYNKILKYHL